LLLSKRQKRKQKILFSFFSHFQGEKICLEKKKGDISLKEGTSLKKAHVTVALKNGHSSYKILQN